jgi:hypothetical protein
MTRWKLTGGATVAVVSALATSSARADWEFSGWTEVDGGTSHVFTGSHGKSATFRIDDNVVSAPMTLNTSVASVVLCNNGDQLPGSVATSGSTLGGVQSVSPSCPDGSAFGGAWVYQ